jgi:glycine oxidase
MATADLTVMGAGVFGLAVAYACARRGAQVRVIDPHGVGTGASGGIVGALAPHVPESWSDKKAFQLDSLLMAAEWWAGVERLSGLPTGYARTGRLQPVPHAGLALARDRGAAAITLWRGQAAWRVVPAADHGNWSPPSPSGWLIHDDLTALIHPRKAVLALAGAIRALGGQIGADGPAEGPVLWATGHAGLTEVPGLGAGEKGQAALLSFGAASLPQLFADGLHLVPHGDATVAVGSTSERVWSDPTQTDAALDQLIARARRTFPMLAHAPVLDRWAGIRPRSASRSPVLGAHPTHPGAFIANGGFKIGFGIAPKVGEVMADLILSGHDSIPAEFCADRGQLGMSG